MHFLQNQSHYFSNDPRINLVLVRVYTRTLLNTQFCLRYSHGTHLLAKSKSDWFEKLHSHQYAGAGAGEVWIGLKAVRFPASSSLLSFSLFTRNSADFALLRTAFGSIRCITSECLNYVFPLQYITYSRILYTMISI